MAAKMGRWPVNTRLRAQIADLEKALVRAVTEHGHEWGCSAGRGMERDCHCGWLEVREMVKRIQDSITGGQ